MANRRGQGTGRARGAGSRPARRPAADWRAAALRDFGRGLSLREVARGAGRPVGVVRAALVRLGCYQLPAGAPAFWREVVRCCGLGAPLDEIALATGRSVEAVERVLERTGLSRLVAGRPAARAPVAWHREAVVLRRQGLTLQQIADRAGVTRQAVSAVLRKGRGAAV